MPKLLKLSGIVEDHWQILPADGIEDLPDGPVLVPMQQWLTQSERWRGRPHTGIWFDSHEDPACVAQDLPHLDTIAIKFSEFTDGRGFSLARLLRERYGYRGELRAIGHILRDQLHYLRRCGFDSFQLINETNLEAASASLQDFTVSYQTVTQIA